MMRNVLNMIFVFESFFRANLSLSDMVDFVFNSELRICEKSGRILLRNMALTLTSEASVFNPKACGVQGHSLGEGCGGRIPLPKNKIIV